MDTRAYRWILGLVLAVMALWFVSQMVTAQVSTTAISFKTVGVLEAMDANSITIRGQIIDIVRAEIKTALEIGVPVKVQGVLLENGHLAALEVNAAQTGILPNEGEFIILWPGDGSTTFSISGVAFDITNASIENGLIAGSQVRLRATLSDTGTWIVREVSTSVNDGNDNSDNNNGANVAGDELRFTGTVDEIGDGFIVVSGARINISGAEIRDQLLVGLLVTAHVREVNGELVARQVQLALQDDDSNNDNVVGTCPPTLPAGWTTYIIQPGDTLSGIASRADIGLENLISANCIDNPRMVVVGTTLFVPRTPDPISDNMNDNEDSDNNSGDNNGNMNDNEDGDNNNDNEDGDNDNGDDDSNNDNEDGDNNEHRGGGENGDD